MPDDLVDLMGPPAEDRRAPFLRLDRASRDWHVAYRALLAAGPAELEAATSAELAAHAELCAAKAAAYPAWAGR